MRLDRAAKYGIMAAIGITIISLTTFWLMQSVQAIVIPEEDAFLSILIIWIWGIAMSLLFLFVGIGKYVDRILEARGLPVPRSREEISC